MTAERDIDPLFDSEELEALRDAVVGEIGRLLTARTANAWTRDRLALLERLASKLGLDL